MAASNLPAARRRCGLYGSPGRGLIFVGGAGVGVDFQPSVLNVTPVASRVLIGFAVWTLGLRDGRLGHQLRQLTINSSTVMPAVKSPALPLSLRWT
jgi:hypothetical protein